MYVLVVVVAVVGALRSMPLLAAYRVSTSTF
jgi:hypothetical protein